MRRRQLKWLWKRLGQIADHPRGTAAPRAAYLLRANLAEENPAQCGTTTFSWLRWKTPISI